MVFGNSSGPIDVVGQRHPIIADISRHFKRKRLGSGVTAASRGVLFNLVPKPAGNFGSSIFRAAFL